MQVRPGKIAFHGAILTLVTRLTDRVRRNSSARGTDRTTADIPVASSACSLVESRRDRCGHSKAAKTSSAGAS